MCKMSSLRSGGELTPRDEGDVTIEMPRVTSRDALTGLTTSTARSGWSGTRTRIPVHFVVFFVLTFIHAAALLVFKMSLVDGAYPFSSASVLSMTEFFKFLLASYLHRREITQMDVTTRPDGIVDSFCRTSTPGLWLAVFVIAALYTANNLLTFFCLARVDPGTVAIAKALVPYVTAIALQLAGRAVNGLQWACIVLQCLGVATTQFHGSSNHAPTAKNEVKLVYSNEMYFWLFLSVVLTTLTSVWNERVIKKHKAPLQQINMLMYGFGAILAFAMYVIVPDYHEKGFFEGYTLMAFVIILVQGIYGLTVGYAYKHADVLIKNLSTSATLAVLVVLSAIFFGKPLNFDSTTGSIIVICTSYVYMIHAHKGVVEGEVCVTARRVFRSVRFAPLDDKESDSEDARRSLRQLVFRLAASISVTMIVLALLVSLTFRH